MDTKLNPDPNSCYHRALPDEPRFTLLGRDADAPSTIRHWSDRRLSSCSPGSSEMAQVEEALAIANAFELWRADHLDAWRGYKGSEPDLIPTPSDEISSIAGRVMGSKAVSGASDGATVSAQFNRLLEDAKKLAGFAMRADREAGPNHG